MVDDPAVARTRTHIFARAGSIRAHVHSHLLIRPCVPLRSVISLMYAAERKHGAHNGGHVLSGDEQLMQPGPFSSNINGMEKYTRTEASSTAKLERLGEKRNGEKVQ